MEGDMKTTQVGICRFCGQTVMFDTTKEWEDEDGGAAMHCTCEQSLRHQLIQHAYDAVELVCVKHAVERGFEVLSPEQVDKIKEACDGILDGSIETVNYRIADGDTIRLQMRKSRVSIKRIRKIEMEAM